MEITEEEEEMEREMWASMGGTAEEHNYTRGRAGRSTPQHSEDHIGNTEERELEADSQVGPSGRPVGRNEESIAEENNGAAVGNGVRKAEQ